ncbi:hypothetical protein H7J87_08375 [Mycolicibacterium wolinskyi]|uniref:Uncharacterized protein n=1 Tax=Mycolicibacterium wolinskyi TaxID=59750 RepID=A0A1X2FH40_9MYCO|nr:MULTISPECIES: hypothetical protein [Mycolicibacterium]MCV7285342.1 hypothetical protein [Mycolicibacterium wolinskyi]MCV7295155.1 hypothetical protein [Mycolicibacterium goodii]ORX17724.1 hypothetical protein AWC31_14870 [Mycolicibacterium wolinskyi]
MQDDTRPAGADSTDNTPTPLGAVAVDDWTPSGWRSFKGTSRTIAADITETTEFRVDIAGEQDRDGTVDRYIHVLSAVYGDAINPAGARALAAALIDAADECERASAM